MLRNLTTALRTTSRSRYPTHAIRAFTSKASDTDDEHQHYHQNLLSGKSTRDNIRSAFTSRCVDSIRYEYFAQRAELEAETDAASLFRSLTETAKQQAMGYMELLEEYGDADFGDTLENLECSAEAEKANTQGVLQEHGVVAGREELEDVEQYFEDMADASEKAFARLELTASMFDIEGMEGDDVDEESIQLPNKASS